jgi:hypothetical protein
MARFWSGRGESDEARALYEERAWRSGLSSALMSKRRWRGSGSHGGRPPRMLRPREAAARALFPPASIVSNQGGRRIYRDVPARDPASGPRIFHYNTLTIAQMLDSLDLQEAALAEYAKVEDGPLSEGVRMNRIWLQFRMQERREPGG